VSGSQYVLVNEVSTEHPLVNFVFRTLVNHCDLSSHFVLLAIPGTVNLPVMEYLFITVN